MRQCLLTDMMSFHLSTKMFVSKTVTSSPSLMSLFTIHVPKKPAAPVTKTFISLR